MILPGARLGLLGGGQLGRMFTMAAQTLGYQVTVLDPASDSPAGGIAERHLKADYLDYQALTDLSNTCAAITTEFENVPAEALRFLAQQRIVSPTANSVSIAQDRIQEKQFLSTNGFAVAPFAVIQAGDDLASPRYQSLCPGILKVSQLGYDGKGQVRVTHIDDLPLAFDKLRQVPCVLELLLPLSCEISVILARNFNGEITHFPVIENQHQQGILDVSMVPARVSGSIQQQASHIATDLANKLAYQGVLCVEFFLLNDGQLLINEIAPRPHNSGHLSIDACVTSQFEQQVRTLCQLPLGSTAMKTPAAVMINLLGNLWHNGEPDWRFVLSQPSAKLHLYGKREARPGRKMGHVTVLGDTPQQTLNDALAIKATLIEKAR